MTATSGRFPSQDFISIPQMLRFYRSGIPMSETDNVWICLHGYGQLAKFFMRKFQSVEERIHMVFPEAMHRFYLEGNNGRVGASWMTKEERLTDISNQSRYLDALYEQVIGMGQHRVTVIGFSQGASTASRWACATSKPLHDLVLWSSAFPPDLPDMIANEQNRNMRVYQLIGKEDPYLKANTADINTHFKSPGSHDSEFISFDGGHEIRPEELQILADRIQS